MADFQDLAGSFDAVVIGGGIIGAGTARDLALRGLNVALVEKADYASGTTAGSTRLAHGGLRYLEMLDFGLVRLDLRERERLLRNAPHLVKPLEFLIPIYARSWFYRAKLRAGLNLYDALSYDRSLPGHRVLNRSETLAAEPHLESKDLQEALAYSDAQIVSPERLTIENIVDARRHGAVTRNYTEAIGPLRQNGQIAGVRVRDAWTGAEAEIHARVVVNASGPWFDQVAKDISLQASARIRTTKGIHLACEPLAGSATVLFSRRDNRLFFVIPWLGYSWVGTTDTDFTGDPADAHARPEDVEYLLESAGEFFPRLKQSRVFWTNAGVRALVRQPGSESSVSRVHKIENSHPGLVSILGGKLTGYRAIAEEAADLVCRELKHDRKSSTSNTPLPGGAGWRSSFDPLDSIYGSRAAEVRALADSGPALSQPLSPDYPDIAAQVVHAVRNEQCVRVSDFLMRRSLLGFSRDQGRGAAPAVAYWMARELRWNDARRAREIEDFETASAAGVR